MNRYVCLHGHFYQPPRENPWLESVEHQDSAYPFHDWNARITAECYGPNATSRILSPSGKIAGIMNNYAHISFNMGPTLLSWLEEHEPVIYESILQGDQESRETYSGHGSAIAQAYNHIIMPLANTRDKRTQIAWGLEDFRSRFGRESEGMWLAETAVDIETLELLAEFGIVYTILAPRQGAEVKAPNSDQWVNVSDARIDPRRPYKCNLPSGRSIALFFYDGPIAQDFAFGGLLHSGEAIAERLVGAFSDDPAHAQLVHVAVDGETFGHHHKQGEMALSYAIHHLGTQQLAQVTNYGEYLEKFPPDWEVRIHENSSWSCVHGVERWRSDCGCNSGGHGDWNQSWRRPLREALDFVRDKFTALFEETGRQYFTDVWTTRDAYIRLMLDRSSDNVETFLEEFAVGVLDDQQRQKALQLLEMQRQSLLMYTSCGWFFDELSGIETTQIMRYAARGIQLYEQVSGQPLENDFIELLGRAPSNIPEFRDGAEIYKRFIKPGTVDLLRVGIHYAVSSLFEDDADANRIYCFDVEATEREVHRAGRFTAAMGRARIRSRLTLESSEFSFAVLHLGDQSLSGGIREFMGEDDFACMKNDIRGAFQRNDIPEVIRRIDSNFEVRNYSFWHLFHEEQRRIMKLIFAEAESEMEKFHRDAFHNHYPLMSAMATMGTSLPSILKTTVEFVLNRDLLAVLEKETIPKDEYESIKSDIEKWRAEINRNQLGYEGSKRLAALSDELAEQPLENALVDRMCDLLEKYRELKVPLNLWYSQNRIYEIGLQQFSIRRYLAEQGDKSSDEWTKRFGKLSDLMGVHVE